MRRPGILALSLFPASMALLAGCAVLPPPRLADYGAAPRPIIRISEDGRVASTTLDVLTFNLEGLAWPARRNRAPALRAISRTLSDLQAAGRAPDVVLVQEMFSRSATRAVLDTRYANIVSGPSRTQREAPSDVPRMGGPFRWDKGEIGIHLVGGGLAALSRYPIVSYQSEPFGKRRCAGFDCLSNKGMLHIRLSMAGVPEPIDLFNTHMNAQGASGVAKKRHGPAHRLQVRELARFIESRAAPGTPTILGGDFNMRRSALRFARFRDAQPLTLVHQYCGEEPRICDIRMSWDGDEPWMDTQDLQLFSSGKSVTVRPVRVEAMFDGSPGSPRLSDHDGFRVLYRLSWPVNGSGRDIYLSREKPSCQRTTHDGQHPADDDRILLHKLNRDSSRKSRCVDGADTQTSHTETPHAELKRIYRQPSHSTSEPK